MNITISTDSLAILDSAQVVAIYEKMIAAKNPIPVDQRIEFYEKLLDSQSMHISFLLGLFGVFVVAMIGYNITQKRRDVKRFTKKFFKEEKEEIKKHTNEFFEIEKKSIKGLTKKYFDETSKSLIAEIKANNEDEMKRSKQQIDENLQLESSRIKGEMYSAIGLSFFNLNQAIQSVESTYFYLCSFIYYAEGKDFTSIDYVFNDVIKGFREIGTSTKECIVFMEILETMKDGLVNINNMTEINKSQKNEFFNLVEEIKKKAKSEDEK